VAERMSFQHRFPRRLIPGLLLLIAGYAQAVSGQTPAPEQPAMYDVEVVVFRNRSAQSGGERWPVRTSPADWQAGDGFERQPAGEGIEELARDQQTLNNIAGALQRSGSYDVLLHTAWRQAGLDRSLARSWRVPSGTRRAGYELDGSIRLVRERYLHLEVDLDLTQPQADFVPGPGMIMPETVYELRESRRVRRGELHYFDHPLFGVIAQVVAYEPPEPPEMPVPVGKVRVEGSDPAVIGDVPVTPAAGGTLGDAVNKP